MDRLWRVGVEQRESRASVWAGLLDHAAGGAPSPRALLAANPGRVERLTITAQGLRADFSKLAVDDRAVAILEHLAEVAGLGDARARLFAGEVVNLSEVRAATHSAERGSGTGDAVATAAEGHRRAKAMVDTLRTDDPAHAPVRHVVHVGIGGSALGPALLLDALGDGGDGPACHVVANIDGVALQRVLARCDPAATLLVIVSKTFTTLETLTNASSAIGWLERAGVTDPRSRTLAVTAAPARAEAWGVPATHILPFAESVGGRYSLWSAVGLPLAIRCGWPAFQALLDGAAAMDRHFQETPFARNLPAMAGALDVWHAAALRRPTRPVFAYDERLRLLPAYLQQLEMESNGKRVDETGAEMALPTAAVTWGGTGTDAQHAVFQLLHQGTHADPVEFVAVVEPGHALGGDHHRQLLANCFAQGAALLRGRTFAEALAVSGGDHALAGAKTFPGDRPSTTILLDRLTPERLGALLAFYEHRTFTAATLLGINPFDQWGVELGKEMANALAGGGAETLDASTAALMRAAGLG